MTRKEVERLIRESEQGFSAGPYAVECLARFAIGAMEMVKALASRNECTCINCLEGQALLAEWEREK